MSEQLITLIKAAGEDLGEIVQRYSGFPEDFTAFYVSEEQIVMANQPYAAKVFLLRRGRLTIFSVDFDRAGQEVKSRTVPLSAIDEVTIESELGSNRESRSKGIIIRMKDGREFTLPDEAEGISNQPERRESAVAFGKALESVL